ncbi:Oxidoreductase, short-chain dehydrogenase/reductase family [Olavius algarvensis associated proteobacterium Delta 3]|nr:Oxidoreductase, short-chain dehydrogenase/reductase family [Olavius algarvensis associated proteobacterium Delta 3]CAB5107638.1 Oxidoreductase, short-chain dehydrogenase/reductase family [Olavius algarvensis associated proteobacterium Delta 3]
MELEGKVILITGANSGIGKASAELLAEAGMKCLLTARDEKKLDRLTERLPGAKAVVGDMIDPALPQRLVDTALEKFGRLDAVFNNAGVMNIGSIEEADLEALCSMVRLNFEAVVRMSYVALRHMKPQGNGFLINTSSLAGLKTFPHLGAYNGTKFAVEALTDALRMELAGSGVKVAVVEPGRTNTHLFDHWTEDQKFDPAQGMLEPEDVARCVRFILEQPEQVLIPRLLVVPARQPR